MRKRSVVKLCVVGDNKDEGHPLASELGADSM